MLSRFGYHGQVAERCVVFADILGFGRQALDSGARGAQDSLSALAELLSRRDALGEILNWQGWQDRHGLSDSIFLVAADVPGAVAAAAEIFFNLAFVTHQGVSPVLMRGGIARGEVLRVGPIFPESATANLVGEAVVRAVRLEQSPRKGPRLFVHDQVADEIESSASPVHWLLDGGPGAREALWLLPPRHEQANGTLIGELGEKVLALVERHGGEKESGAHYLGYLDLFIRSLRRLGRDRPDQARKALAACRLRERARRLEALLMSPEALLIEQIRELAGSADGRP
jgi:hypothetical protein